MFERMSKVAQQVATSVSRRAFLGKLGQGALAVAGLAGVLSALSPQAQAAGKHKCCTYWSELTGSFNECHSGACPKQSRGANLVNHRGVSTCGECFNGVYG